MSGKFFYWFNPPPHPSYGAQSNGKNMSLRIMGQNVPKLRKGGLTRSPPPPHSVIFPNFSFFFLKKYLKNLHFYNFLSGGMTCDGTVTNFNSFLNIIQTLATGRIPKKCVKYDLNNFSFHLNSLTFYKMFLILNKNLNTNRKIYIKHYRYIGQKSPPPSPPDPYY